MPKLIYLRHGDDRGNDVHRHDRHLNERGRQAAVLAAAHLIETHGHPDVAYVSPYRRAVETIDAMSARFTQPVVVQRDPRVAQLLSEKRQRDPAISPETRAQVAIIEDRDAFRRRVASHVDEVQRHTAAVIWCVTHQVVVERVAALLDVRMNGDLDFLDHLVVVT